MTVAPITKEVLGRRLADARLGAGLTMREAGRRAGFDWTMIVRYEGGQSMPPPERLAALAAVYGTTPAALLAQYDGVMPVLAAIDRAGPYAAAILPIVEQLLASLPRQEDAP
ncbi:MAG: Helix-turn-helix domain [Chloroflexota bacterium]|jgi:transcriptional regulator with XRE-family HTH domain